MDDYVARPQPSVYDLERAYLSGQRAGQDAFERLSSQLGEEQLIVALERLLRQGTRQLGCKGLAKAKATDKRYARADEAATRLAGHLERALRTVDGQKATLVWLALRWRNSRGKRKHALRGAIHSLCQATGLHNPISGER